MPAADPADPAAPAEALTAAPTETPAAASQALNLPALGAAIAQYRACPRRVEWRGTVRSCGRTISRDTDLTRHPRSVASFRAIRCLRSTPDNRA